jgi:glycosyltransferase involved in cell wall biosynthesis
MSPDPPVSVVMSVYNGAATLAATLDSVLSQQGVAFEFVVIDDGSTDGSGVLLDDFARRDKRLRVIHQENRGLTRALIQGCAAARGQFIARQDAGDLSLPGRLARQFALLESNPEEVMTSCGTRFLGPGGEFLYADFQQGDELHVALEQSDRRQLRGPSSHPSVMFRRATYQAVGGYRPEFRVAQDLDLWMRLVEQGHCGATPEVLYEAVWQAGSISHLRREQQVLATEAILECRERRRRGESERPVLDRLQADFENSRTHKKYLSGLVHAKFNYFVGSLLADRDPLAARRYLYNAVVSWPLHFKAWWKLLRLLASPMKKAG